MKSAPVAGNPFCHCVGTESPSEVNRAMSPPPKYVMDSSTSLSERYILDSTFSWLAPLSSRGLPDGALYQACCQTLRSELRSVTVWRAQVSPGKPVGPFGVSRLAVVVKKQRAWAESQLAETCIWIDVAGSTAIELVLVSDAAAAVPVGTRAVIARVVTPIAASRFILANL